MYFGTIDGPLAKMQDIPCALTPITVSRGKYSTEMQFENGGIDVVSSRDSHKRFSLSYSGNFAKDDDNENIDIIKDYYDGQYGDGLIYFDDPTIRRGDNVLRRNWATPALGENGYSINYKRGYPNSALYGEFVDVTPGYGSPSRALKIMRQGDVESSSLEDANYITFISTVVVPAGFTLHVAVRSENTGGQIMILPKGAVTGTVVTENAIGSNDLFTNSATDKLNGPAVADILILISGIDPDTSYISIQSLDAIILPNGVTPPATGDHKPGRGSSGFKFGPDLPQEFTSAHTGQRYISAELIEVGEWQN